LLERSGSSIDASRRTVFRDRPDGLRQEAERGAPIPAVAVSRRGRERTVDGHGRASAPLLERSGSSIDASRRTVFRDRPDGLRQEAERGAP
ncbi:hypothetical protein CTI14_64540, partial [Methylobacterium radiotolerans]